MVKLKQVNFKVLVFFLYSLVLAASLVLKLANLNYNSPFNDEAIYPAIGRLGLYEHDWHTYSAFRWMAGHPFFYPVLSTLASFSGGVLGARFLNVVLGVLTLELVFVIAWLLAGPEKDKRLFSGLISVALVGGATIGHYVARLATYDAPSFFLFFLSLMLLLRAPASRRISRDYFWAAIVFLLALMFKTIIALYLLPVLVFSFWQAKKSGFKPFLFWQRYFLAPLLLGLVIFWLIGWSSLKIFLGTQVFVERYPWQEIVKTFGQNTAYLWGFWLFGSLGMLLKRKWPVWLFLTIGALWVLLVHLLFGRWISLEKHLFLSVVFLSLVAGIGLAEAWVGLKTGFDQTTFLVSIGFLLILFWQVSYFNLDRFNHLWRNASPILDFLTTQVKRGDKVLTETGGAVIWALYEQNYPLNMTTFDWFEYHHLQDEEAYMAAVRDGYFDLIELEAHGRGKTARQKKLHRLVERNLEDNYKLVYDQHDFTVYQRKF